MCDSSGLAPTNYYLFYTPKVLALIALRWLTFARKKQHYLLYDFCYWASYHQLEIKMAQHLDKGAGGLESSIQKLN